MNHKRPGWAVSGNDSTVDPLRMLPDTSPQRAKYLAYSTMSAPIAEATTVTPVDVSTRGK
jgi:hypothetical protein